MSDPRRRHIEPPGPVALSFPRRCGKADRVINSRSASSAPAGYRFAREVIAVAVRWYLRYALSYRDVEELLAERGIAVEADHGRLKARLRPMRGLKTALSLRTIAAGHAFVQNLRRGHYELAVDLPAH